MELRNVQLITRDNNIDRNIGSIIGNKKWNDEIILYRFPENKNDFRTKTPHQTDVTTISEEGKEYVKRAFAEISSFTLNSLRNK